mmetsp:Transcript_18739/g.30203  ORF Transcript_18739/g.30203 Transcript_18739/m.30203 type:complete len:137 (-) Transcript_18739:277-687(-)
MMTMKTMIPLIYYSALCLLSSPVVNGWIEPTTTRRFSRHFAGTILHSDASSDGPASESNPCWQDMYDDDCAMETIFSASYTPAEWIKKLPCAKGLEDCDFPEDLQEPTIRPEAHAEEIDVMEFLHIKRAPEVDDKK